MTNNTHITYNARREQWGVSAEQRGFLRGRSLLQNVLDMEHASMEHSLFSPRAAAVYFDLKAAFPSVSQEFLLTTLRALRLPEHVLNFVRALYDQNRCGIAVAGSHFGGFSMESGIKQGCPLSPAFVHHCR